MSITKVNQSDLESFSIVTNPLRHYSSSSLAGVTGSVHVFARRSSIEKEVAPLPAFIDLTRSDADINVNLTDAVQAGRRALRGGSTAPYHDAVSLYMDKVNAQSVSARKQKALDIIRFTPTVSFTSNTVRKSIVKDVLMPYYRPTYQLAHWAFTNYNSLNFFTSSTVPTGSALLYPNVHGGQDHEGYVSGTYSLSGAFSFDFYVNPRYQSDSPNGQFKAGTLLHLSSSYAVSLVSGSAKDENGRQLGFRVQLQLSQSADKPPSRALKGNYPNDLVFQSDDNSLLLNHWHHVVVRWGTSAINNGTGSFNIDGTDRGQFVVPSGTITPKLYPGGGQSSPDVLVVGNFYEGKNIGTDSLAYFFATDPATRDGLNRLITDTGDAPGHYAFNHPLNAEVHDVSIKRYYMSDTDIFHSASHGPAALDNRVAFYLPPFFVESSPFRTFVGNHGGVLQTPFFEVDGTTAAPFNVAMAFGVDGHYMNIENYVKDFASDVFPRVHLMTGTVLQHSTLAREANAFLYDDPLVRRRNLLLLPCDDGLFVPGFELLASESLRRTMVGDDGVLDTSLVQLDDMLFTSSLLFGTSFDDVNSTSAASSSEFVNLSVGFTPEQPGLPPGPAFNNFVSKVKHAVASGTVVPGVEDGAPLTIYQRTLDPSSDQVTFFDISNMFYGNRIMPGSMTITDTVLSGSGGAFGITLKDDGFGNLYRANSYTSSSTWNSVGNVFYDEGIVVIKNPALYFFGKEQFEFDFRGEQSIHSLKLEVIAPEHQLNSSSNPGYMTLSASGDVIDDDSNYVYITGLNFHDKELNVVMKTQLAQPIVKRFGSRILFKVAIDFLNWVPIHASKNYQHSNRQKVGTVHC